MHTSPLTFQQASEQLSSRLPRETALKYRQILAQWAPAARQRAFFSARVADATVLSELRRRALQVVNGEMTQKQAVRLVREYFAGEGADALAALGFAPKRTARGVEELASIPRLRLIMETNARMAQECGHYRQWEAVKDLYPIGVWHCGYSEVHRPEHLARDGKAYAFDHPIWTQSPPGGEFNCHCWRENLTREDAARRGLVPEPPDSPFAPSSLGFDPSRSLDGSTVKPGSRVLPQLAQKAQDAKCPDYVLKDMAKPSARNLKELPLARALEEAKEETDKIGGFATEDMKARHAEWTDNRDKALEAYRKARKAYDKLTKEHYIIPKEMLRTFEEQRNEIAKQAGIYNENVDALQKQADEFTDLFAIAPKDRGKVNIAGYVPQEFRAKWEKARDFLEKHIAADYLNDAYMIKRYRGKRSEYREWEKSLYMSNNSPAATFVHELCHGIEHSNPHVKQRCLEFLEKRCFGEDSVSLTRLCPGRGYSRDEKARKDNFFDPYCGKDYFGVDGKRNATELLSMGAERLYYDPIGFMQQDQEYFNFVVDLLRGNI